MLSRLQMCIYGKAIEQQYGTLNTIYNQIMCEGGAKGTPPLHFQVTSHTYTTLGCHMTWGISLLTPNCQAHQLKNYHHQKKQ